jgi:hypothetical protein
MLFLPKGQAGAACALTNKALLFEMVELSIGQYVYVVLQTFGDVKC